MSDEQPQQASSSSPAPTRALAKTSKDQPTESKKSSKKSTSNSGNGNNAPTAEAKLKKKNKQTPKSKSLKSKVVVRRLPPNLPENVFFATVKPWANEQTINWSLYVPGKLKGKGKDSIMSRAYFHFKSIETVLAFHHGFDGHIFVDKQGTESKAVVEFAPFQKILKEHKKLDPKQGTIESDADYIAFLESLKAEEQKASEPPKDEGLTEMQKLENRLSLHASTTVSQASQSPKSTPLLEFLRTQKTAQAAARAKQQAARLAARQVQNPTAILSRGTKNIAKQQAGTPSKPGGTAISPSHQQAPSGKNRQKKRKEERRATSASEKEGENSRGTDGDTANRLSETYAKAPQIMKQGKDQIRQILVRQGPPSTGAKAQTTSAPAPSQTSTSASDPTGSGLNPSQPPTPSTLTASVSEQSPRKERSRRDRHPKRSNTLPVAPAVTNDTTSPTAQSSSSTGAAQQVQLGQLPQSPQYAGRGYYGGGWFGPRRFQGGRGDGRGGRGGGRGGGGNTGGEAKK